MAYQTPKTDWNESYTPTPSDMNRIEGNVEDNRAKIIAEETARIAGDNNLAADLLLEESARIAADGVLNTALGVETSARISVDATKLNHSSFVSRTYSTITLPSLGSSAIIPAGTYMVVNAVNEIQFRDSGGTWRRLGISSLLISDGSNLRIIAIGASPQTLEIIKIA